VKILVDMNLSPEWVGVLSVPGWTVRRWNEVGRPEAEDPELASWAVQNGFFILTQDLDFSDILFMTQADAPSVILLRHRDEHSAEFRTHVRHCLVEMEKQLQAPSLVVIDRHHARWRSLPIGGNFDRPGV
jgi:predicted nuclease of predicted toxin-antitoxin system